ncbi:hypothetical protein D3C71_1755100 [compost metagenome]
MASKSSPPKSQPSTMISVAGISGEAIEPKKWRVTRWCSAMAISKADSNSLAGLDKDRGRTKRQMT